MDPDLIRYSDGRPVTTTVRWDDPADQWGTTSGWAQYVWHPDPLLPDNRPGRREGAEADAMPDLAGAVVATFFDLSPEVRTPEGVERLRELTRACAAAGLPTDRFAFGGRDWDKDFLLDERDQLSEYVED